MDNANQRLDQFFETARKQAPEASLEETRKAFLVSSGIGLTALLAQFKITKSFLIMFSTITLISTLVGLLVVNHDPTPIAEMDQNTFQVIASNFPKVEQETVQIAHSEVIEEDLEESFSVIIVNDSQPVDAPVWVAPTPSLDTDHSKHSRADYSPILPVASEIKDSILIKEEEKALEEKMVTYVITNKSHYKEMEAISEVAKKAGIEFKYSMQVHSNYIRKLNLTMSIKGKGKTSKTKAKGKFKVTFGWYLDESGNATKFFDKDDISDE